MPEDFEGKYGPGGESRRNAGGLQRWTPMLAEASAGGTSAPRVVSLSALEGLLCQTCRQIARRRH